MGGWPMCSMWRSGGSDAVVAEEAFALPKLNLRAAQIILLIFFPGDAWVMVPGRASGLLREVGDRESALDISAGSFTSNGSAQLYNPRRPRSG